jgi:hypothetical protein
MATKAQAAGVKLTSEGFAYILRRSTEGHRYIVGGRVSETAQAERSSRAKIQIPVLKKKYHRFVMDSKPTNLTFTYDRSPDFSVRYADGASIKALPGGSLYIERPHEFEKITYEISPEGALGKQIDSVVKEGVCRQLQCAIVTNPAAARAIASGIIQVLDKRDAADLVKPAVASPQNQP